MHPIRATWTNGQILPSQPVDWPEGLELVVEPISFGKERIGMTEEEWDAISDEEWEAAVRSIQPLEFTDEERAPIERFDEEVRRLSIEAVRRRMETGDF
jgi:hypothetical protein